jgi:DNA-binding CsgD family transcriptional regulator
VYAPPTRLALVGREREREQLRAALTEAAGGGMQLVVIEGEAGIGKSRLLADLLDHAGAHGARTWYGAADELERHRPLRAVVDALGPLPAAGAGSEVGTGDVPAVPANGWLPPAGPMAGGASDATFLAVEAAVDRVERAVAGGPAMLAVEDLHWADPATLQAVRALTRRLAALPLLVAVTLRPAPRSPELDRLLAALPAATTRHLALTPLGEADVAVLAGSVAAGAPTAGLLAEVRAAGGNPLYVIELVRALAVEGRVSVVAGVADVAGTRRRIPESLRRTVQRRMAVLSPAALDLLRMAAVLGATFAPAELSAAVGAPMAELLPALQETVDAGVLTEAGERLAFRHELLRDALYDAIPVGVRTALHRGVGQALAAAGAPADRVAVHLSLGARPGDRDAVSWLRRAARQAAAGDPAAAADLLARAVQLLPATDPDRDRLLAELAGALTVAGRAAEAASVAQRVLAREHDPAAEALTRLALGQALWSQGRLHEWMDQIERGSRAAALTAAERARFHAEAAGGYLTFGRLARAEEEGAAAIAAGRAAGDDLTVCLGLSARSIAAHYRAHFAAAMEQGAEVVELASRSAPHELGRRFFYGYQGMFLAVADRLDAAVDVIGEGRALSARLGVVADLPPYHYVGSVVHLYAGRWDDAVAEAETCVAVAQEIDTRSAVVGALAVLAHIALHRGALADAEGHLAAAQATLRESGPQWGMDWVAWAEALVHEARGRPEVALDALAAAWARHLELGLDHVALRIGPDLVRLQLAAGEGRPAAETAELVATVAERAGAASARAAATRCRGLVTGDPDVLLDAVSEYAAGPRALDRARAAEDAATALARRGRPAEAAARFAEALTLYDRVGASRDLSRAAAAQRRAGIRRGARGTRRRPAHGWASLTATELAVAQLATEGLTNPQIGQRLYISRYTVETHLKHVFAKLSLSSRVQLAAEVARRAG